MHLSILVIDHILVIIFRIGRLHAFEYPGYWSYPGYDTTLDMVFTCTQVFWLLVISWLKYTLTLTLTYNNILDILFTCAQRNQDIHLAVYIFSWGVGIMINIVR